MPATDRCTTEPSPTEQFATDSTAERRLIVNADDLGRTRGINEGILDAHRRGIVTSATLMVNYEPAREAVAMLQKMPRLGLGLHLALTGGVPTLPADQVPSLVDARGLLPAKPKGLVGADPHEISREAKAQLERFRELTSAEPTHFDSHHHSHRIPAVCDALIELARECDRPVRCASLAIRQRLGEAGVKTSDAFVERFFGEAASLPVLLEILRELEPGTTEVMCHPARVDEDLRRGSNYVDERERELAVLTDSRVAAAVEDLGVLLVNFETCAN